MSPGFATIVPELAVIFTICAVLSDTILQYSSSGTILGFSVVSTISTIIFVPP